ncbi:unnamed protein product [Leuciscus chuanchicus]
MDLLNLMTEITAFILLIQWRTSDSTSHSIVATCQQEFEDDPEEYSTHHDWNPSPVHALTAELSESQSSLTVRWAINVDSTIRSLTGTWVTWSKQNDKTLSSYRCRYKPDFSSDESLAGLQQLWFSFTVSNVSLCPSTNYNFLAYNLPPPNPGTGDTYLKSFEAEIQWNAHIYSVLHDDKILVTFNVSSAAYRHIIKLENPTKTLKTVEIKEGCKVEKCHVELEYTGPCEDLKIWITSQFEHCKEKNEVRHKVNCMIPGKSGLATGVGCVLALLSVLLCGCITCQMLRWVRGSKRGACVRVLLVYPAVDGVFQRTVMLLAQSLQSRAGVTVVIDMWDRGSLAEQGPLRWINTQAELADKVLIITPPQTDDLKSNLVPSVSDDMVSASASSLFALTLNLVSSAARDPLGRDKFWVVNLQAEDPSVRPELRGFRRFLLPRDSEKLHQKLQSCFSSFTFRNAFKKMEIHTDLLTCAQDDSRDPTPA